MTHSAVTKYQPDVAEKAALTTVPKVRLYVERMRDEKWFVHIGHVTDRGRWRTEPHAHPKYGQVLFVRHGSGVMNLEGNKVPFAAPCVLLVPPEYVHGLDYEVDIDRWVVTIEVSYLTQINAKLHEFIQLWSLPRVIPMAYPTEAASDFFSLIQKLELELKDKTVGHIISTEALLTSLLLMLIRGTSLNQIDNDGVTRNEVRLADRFRELIDQHYRQNLPLQDYASMMAVSLVQLRAACSSATGQSPTKMIHARIITEAKRNLIFGDTSVEQIAFSLGFADAAYFTRFFRKEVGETPSQFRISARQQSHRAK
jgi:AraC family transcriptional activator of pobA